jgi:hypothetical protein
MCFPASIELFIFNFDNVIFYFFKWNSGGGGMKSNWVHDMNVYESVSFCIGNAMDMVHVTIISSRVE